MTRTSSSKLTVEEKERFAPMLRRTYAAIADDAACRRISEIIEVTCDANRPEMFGGMTREEYQALCAAYDHPDTRRWLRSVLNY